MTSPLILGQISLPFHQAAAAVVARLLRELGHDVMLQEAPHEEMYEQLEKGAVDLVCSAWLPASHGKYIAHFEDSLEKLSILYTPYCIWGVPPNAPADLTSVADLARPEIASQFRKLIQGINPGAGISRFSRQMITEYRLDVQGFHFENGTLDDCTSAYLDASLAGDFAVLPLWHPQWLHTKTTPRELSDPKGLLGGQDDATLVLRKDASAKLSEDGMTLLRNITLGNAAVSELDRAICRDGQKPDQAAAAWIIENRRLCDRWIEGKSDV
ncbi:hypothetical protein BWR17_19105 (plasmid) [Phaeobacter inhibens]|uniref:glycine betaine ABC transporter substrate-binding protein n=1 Tax=Phaeobacter inhibens TaxID=221822 RepID=UPI0009719AAF|nr:glycine betaine ABC transporter substrate-binding protein [Phaeobacter inhibens]APX18001.1 hypothetical protein BWR17_19105 [Phaeobacter inhibens]